MTRQFACAPLVAVLLCVFSTLCLGQNETTTLPPSPPLNNGGFEQGEAGSEPAGWAIRSGSDGTGLLDRSISFEGTQCVVLDATKPTDAERLFLNMVQGLDAKPYQGKRIRFRAAVQVADLLDDARVQLWMRVDQPKGADGKSESSSFDNMSDRSIHNESWLHHDIVLDVAPDAARILCGAFVIGVGKAWIDDASVQIVGQNVPTTDGSNAFTSATLVAPAPSVATPTAEKPEANAAKPQAANNLVNGNLEDGEVGTAPPGWRFSSNCGGTVVIDRNGPMEGQQSAMVDATKGELADRPFTNLMQSFDAAPWQGKRVKFRAAVQVSELTKTSTTNLWMRVDQPEDKEGNTASSSFDNMGDRPIRNEQWAYHEIVLDIAPDAARIALGMFVIGTGKAWLDDA